MKRNHNHACRNKISIVKIPSCSLGQYAMPAVRDFGGRAKPFDHNALSAFDHAFIAL
jgi:hypothetical protein